MPELTKKNETEFYPKLCSSTLFFTVLRFKKRRSGKQEECFKDFLGIIDPTAVDGIYDTSSFHKYASDCRNAKELPVDGDYIRFGDKGVCSAFRNEFKQDENAAIERMVDFVNKYIVDSSHASLIRALLELIEADKSIDGHNRSLYVKPGLSPALKDEILNSDEIYFYNFLIGIWYYVYDHFEGHTDGLSTIEAWTEKTKEYSADKVNCDIGNSGKYDNVKISYETKTEFDTQEVIEEILEYPTTIVSSDGIAPDLADFDLEDEMGLLVMEPTKVRVVSDKFSKYVKGALDNYSMKKGFLDSQERPFRDFYVCNDVCQRNRSLFKNMDGDEEIFLNRAMTNVKIDDLGRHFSVFTGIGGMGKSMLLLKFLLDEAEGYQPGGRVPIMVTLRTYRPDEKSLEMLLATELKRFDSSLQLSDLYYLLDSGKAVCLLDGFDEVKKEYIHDFQDELDVMKDGRPDTYFIMSSRDIPEIRTLNHYFEYELMNLSTEQACELISRLDPNRVSAELKKDFISKLQKDAFHFNHDEKRNFVGNPLFLSLMIRTYDMLNDIPRERYIFYEKTYVAMASEYDSTTKRMTRPFFTGLNEKTFQNYFAEFCALTYSDCLYEFDRDTMLNYFYQVVKDNNLDIDPELFIRDVTEKICLIYKDGSVYEFIHRSFQEYFAACYFLSMLSIDKDTVQETLNYLDNKITKDETISMMYGMDDRSVEKYVFLPFLEKMFAENDDEEDYKKYIRTYYPAIEYITGDMDEGMCANNSQKSALFCFIKNQYHLGHDMISGAFDYDENYADMFEEYFWIEEYWFSGAPRNGSMRLVQAHEIPASYFLENGIDSTDEITHDKGYLCSIELDKYLDDTSDAVYYIIMDDTFALREEFNRFKALYEQLKNKYDESNNTIKRKLGLRRN